MKVCIQVKARINQNLNVILSKKKKVNKKNILVFLKKQIKGYLLNLNLEHIEINICLLSK